MVDGEVEINTTKPKASKELHQRRSFDLTVTGSRTMFLLLFVSGPSKRSVVEPWSQVFHRHKQCGRVNLQEAFD